MGGHVVYLFWVVCMHYWSIWFVKGTWDNVEPQQDWSEAYICAAGIICTGHLVGSEQRICIINSCAPYSDRKYFWENVSCYVILGFSSLVIVGDLNFSLGQGEISGTKLWWMNYLYFSLCYWHHTKFLILFLHLWVLLGTTGVKGWREYLRGWIDSF